MKETTVSTSGNGILGRAFSEIRHFGTYPFNMRILLLTNMLYAFVLPVVELFVGTYIMRNSSELAYVVGYQLAVYTGIPLTFLVNGFLMRRIRISHLYSFGMLLSGVSMAVMMSLETLDLAGIVVAGLIMGLSYGFFWANRDFLALNSTDDGNRNYYYGLESFFNTVAGVVVPGMIGAFLGATADHNWLGGNINLAYKLVTLFVFALTIIASAVVFRGRFSNPPKERFIYLRFDVLWNKMMRLAVLKGIAQGYIVTAPSMLVMTLVGNESTLGTLQSVSAIVSAVLLYLLGRFASARHRVLIFSSGLLLFALGGAFNAVLYSATGAIVFMLCLVMGASADGSGLFPDPVAGHRLREPEGEPQLLRLYFRPRIRPLPRPFLRVRAVHRPDDLPVGYLCDPLCAAHHRDHPARLDRHLPEHHPGARQGRGGIEYPARGQEGQPRAGTMRRGSVAAGGYRPGLCPRYGGPARIGNAAAAERLRFALL